TQSTAKHEVEEEEEYSNQIVYTPSDYQLSEEEEKNDDEGMIDEEEEEEDEQVEEDSHVIVTPVIKAQKADDPVQSSSVSSDFTSKLLNLDNTPPRLDETSSQTSSLFTILVTAILEITSATTVPLPHPFFNPIQQEATPTPTPTTSEATTSTLALPNFASVFRFNKKVTNLEKYLSEMKHIDQYATALSSIPAIMDRYIENKLGEAINKSIHAHNLDYRQEAQDEDNEYIGLAVSDFATPIIEKNVSESLETAVVIRSSSEPQSTGLYNALITSYEADKDLFDTYGEVFSLKRGRDDKGKDQDPSAGSDRGSKRRKSSKDAESSRDSSHTVEDTGVQLDQEFVTGDNDEQPDDKEVIRVDCQAARAEEPRTSFDKFMDTLFNKFMDTSFDFSAFFLNRLNIIDLTQEILVGPAFNLMKGTCKSITKLEYHLEEYSKDTIERLDWHNPEGKPYPFDLRKPLPLISDHRGRQVIPQDYLINNDLEYLKGGDLGRRYLTSVTKTKATIYDIKWIEDLVRNLWSTVIVKYDKQAYLGISHWGPKRQRFYGYASNLTSSKDVYSRRDDQQLYTFKEGDFPRLRLEDMLLLVQQKLTNFTINERYDLNVALRMYTRRIVIQRRVEDL
ncbi:hypothetical protein Tco_1426804, partial [Tanacetum coccineum]